MIVDEDRDGLMPSISVGLQDFGGTGVFGAEYFAASKHLTDRVTATVGIGWGRLGSHNGFENPLAIFNDSFRIRPGNTGDNTGKVSFNQFFRGDAAIFAAADWQATENLRLSAEYSSDSMTPEVENMGYDYRIPINIGAQYRFAHGGTLGASLLSGSTIGVSYSFTLDPENPPSHSGREPGPPAIGSGSTDSLQAWTPAVDPAHRARLAAALRDQGIAMTGIEVRGTVAVIDIDNLSWPAAAQAYGRTAAVLSVQLPHEISAFQIRTHERGMPITQVTLRRSDLEDLEYALDGSWQSYARAGIADAALSPGASPLWQSSADLWVVPYVTPFFFDPDNPLRADAGIAVAADWSPFLGGYLSGAVNKKLVGNLDQADRPSNSVLPHVRSDAWLYAKEGDFYLPYLTVSALWRPGEDLYARASAGLLERMFGGVSGEMLWAPPGEKFSFGMDLSYVKQRDFQGFLGFQDYDVVTGFLSGYYDFGGGFLGQVDVGRYLAKDWGATFTVNRRFNNGFEFGAFATLTDVSTDDFGEGAFDKGIMLSIPISWITGKPSRDHTGFLLRPILRDGGAQLIERDRLYALTRPDRQEELASRWGQFWR